MTNPSASTKAPFARSSFFLGGVSAVLSLAFDLAFAWSLVLLTRQHLSGGTLWLCGVLAARWVTTTLLDQWAHGVKRTLQRQWRLALVDQFRLPRAEQEQARGDLASAIESAAQAPALNLLMWASRAIMLGVVVVFVAAGWLSVLVVVGLMALSVPMYQRAGKKSEEAARRYEQRRRVLEGRQLELLRHSVELRALGALQYGASEIEAISSTEHDAAASAIAITMQSSLVTEFLSGVSIGLVAMVVGFGLLEGKISLLRALTAVLVTSDIFLHVRRFGQEFHRQENAVQARELLVQRPTPTSPTSTTAVVEAIDLRTFTDSTPLTFMVNRGERVLVKGPSGSGKSTLLAVLVGWQQPHSGSVARSQARIGVVRAASSLLAGTLRENLVLNTSASDEELANVVGELGLGERFSDLSYRVAPSGDGVSDGERVRLLIARALLQGVSVLVLDDLGGLLDAASVAAVRRTLDVHPELTIIEAAVDEGMLPPSHVVEVGRG